MVDSVNVKNEILKFKYAKHIMKHKKNPVEQLKKYWFSIGILVCIILASIFPQIGIKNGPLKPEYTVKYGCVSLIFLISGLSLKTDSFTHTFRHYKLHLFIQCFSFCAFPLLVQILMRIFAIFGFLDGWIRQGLITVACMPPPVSSAVILTRAAHGNEAAAIFNSVLGSFLGILLTPLLLLLNLGWTTLVPLTSTILQLLLTILAPLVVGHALRHFPLTSFRVRPSVLPTFGVLGQAALLLVVFTAFCDTFTAREFHLSAMDILSTVFLVLLLQLASLTTCFFMVQKVIKQTDAPDVIASVFCATHKSLTLGLPMLRIMFHGFSHLGQISLPLLVYHPTQIILGGFLVPVFKEWLLQQKNQKYLPL